MFVFCRLLVGAPRAAAIRGQKSTVTGGLFSCDMSSSAPCTRVNFDNDGEVFCSTVHGHCHHHSRLYVSLFFCRCIEDLKRESKQNQWMGVTVSSQGPGGKVMVSLPIFELKKTFYNIHPTCFMSS